MINSTLTILVVDDEKLARERLCQSLSKLPASDSLSIHTAADVPSALRHIEEHRPDIIILDIDMPGVNGLALAKLLQHMEIKTPLIFVTAYGEYALEAFDLNVCDYLTKPVKLDRLEKVINKAMKNIAIHAGRQLAASRTSPSFTYADRGKLVRLDLQNVLYFKADQKYVVAQCADGEHILNHSLNELEEKFSDTFLRIHRSTLVAKHAILTLQRSLAASADEHTSWELTLRGVAQTFPVSRRQLAQVKDFLKL